MVTCSFLCSRMMIDIDFYDRLQVEIDKLVRQDDEIDFLFTQVLNKCMALCLSVVLEAKHANPDKRIWITLVTHSTAAALRAESFFPVCTADRIRMPPVASPSKKDRDFLAVHTKVRRWIYKQSDYIISYCYDDLNSDKQMQQYVKKTRAVRIDLTQQGTKAFIRECMDVLTPAQQSLKALLDQGLTYQKIGANWGISGAAVRMRANKMISQLKYHVLQKKKGSRQWSAYSDSAACCIVDFNTAAPLTAERHQAFQQAVNFIVENFARSIFIVEQSMCYSRLAAIAKVLCRTKMYINDMSLEIYQGAGRFVPMPLQPPPDAARKRTKYSPEQTRQNLLEALGASQYVIFNGSENLEPLTGLLDEVSKCSAVKLRPKLLDISREPTALDAGGTGSGER